ncbi:serine protease DegQ [Jezberella montanilacus]|uniref:Serine protease DegQ n=1 Tax=Jezberella montanilacus TaxID=323426 RepID=A0A2T0XHH5_9BURK|nr:trypsin-like peptidase domain-containing protein [Jezberella montanilacus]PRY98404.1 serine protease DegQ [Jezberella montanilacus]|eukprot:gene2206-2240_t
MRRIWLLFAQTVTVCLGVLFVVVTLRPDWLGRATTKQASPPLALNTNVDPSKLSKESERMARSFNAPTSFANGVAAATPGVVNIFTTKHVAVSRLPLPADPFIRKFFEQMPGFSERRQSNSLGSGVVVSKAGHILTNFHVIDGAEEILVALSDGRQANAKVIGVDPETDLGVLKIELPDLHVLPFATQETLRVGDVVLAIGNPFGVGQTTTMGIVSALGRDGLGINVYENFIQTDAAINPGNSGGALIDTQGKLVGINTAIYSQSGGSLGIGFAIPASAALRVMDQIIKEGRVKRGWLGIEPQDMTAELARAFGVEQAQGAIVAGIVRDGPAMIAGLQVGDIIQHLDGRKVEDANRLLGRIAALLPGKTVKLDVVRKAQHQDITVTLGTKPPINR